MRLRESEIRRGLVLHLSPPTLESEGAMCTCAESLRVQGDHFFLVVETVEEDAVLIPLYSEDGVGRTKLPAAGRSGHPKWTEGDSYWHQDQKWVATKSAIVKAAAAGRDQSTAKSRNVLADAQIPDVLGG